MWLRKEHQRRHKFPVFAHPASQPSGQIPRERKRTALYNKIHIHMRPAPLAAGHEHIPHKAADDIQDVYKRQSLSSGVVKRSALARLWRRSKRSGS